MPMVTRVREHVSSPAAGPAAAAAPGSLAGLSERIRSEYEEMPCLRLTLPQASRFWNVDRDACQAALDQLVAEGVLVLGRYGYMRA
jgi:hypothetical protein